MKYKILQLTIAMPFGGVENIVYPTLLWDNQNIILVDCGFIGALHPLEEELQRYGLSLHQITGLVLTHHDHDHMGAAAALKKVNPEMKVYSSSLEASFISAKEKPLRLCQAEEMQKTLPLGQQDFGKAFCEMLRGVEPVAVDCLLNDGDHLDWCVGCRVIGTPGHTPGHISLFMENDAIMVTGDAIALEDNQPVIANPQFTLDMEQASKSMENLLSMKASFYYCYHGGIYSPVDGNHK